MATAVETPAVPHLTNESCCIGFAKVKVCDETPDCKDESINSIRLSRWFSIHSMMCLGRCNTFREGNGFHCDCRRGEKSWTGNSNESRIIDFAEVCDGAPDCKDGSDEVDCLCSDNQFQCSRCERGDTDCNDPFYCLPRANVEDGRQDCWLKEDETP